VGWQGPALKERGARTWVNCAVPRARRNHIEECHACAEPSRERGIAKGERGPQPHHDRANEEERPLPVFLLDRLEMVAVPRNPRW
jgi:hypothetical protein